MGRPPQLSGIPGTGRNPVQDVAPTEVSEFIRLRTHLGTRKNTWKTFAAADSAIRLPRLAAQGATVNGSPRYVALTVDFQFTLGSLSSRFATLSWRRARALEPGQRAESALVRVRRCFSCAAPRAWCSTRGL